MATVTLKLNNVQEFNHALAMITAYSQKPVEETMNKQAKLLVEKIIGITPPFGKRKGLAARDKGFRTVEGNIRKVLNGVPVAANRKLLSGVGEGEVARHHEKNRKRGRVSGANRRGNRKLAPQRLLDRYIKRRKDSVGMLAAGWNAAASKFRASPRAWPSFVKKHNPSSQATVKVTKTKIKIRMVNGVRFAGDLDTMSWRMDWALKRSAIDNTKIINNYKRGAKKAGFRVV